MRTHYEIPATFDGEIPEFAFSEHKDIPRLKFGQWYLIPNVEGVEIPGRLYEAVVMEERKKVFGVYETEDGKHVICTTPLTDEELQAWKRHPETFFGQVKAISGQAQNWLELAKFMYQTYKDTDREPFLEWMKDASDLDELRALSQKDLAIVYCERVAWSGFKDSQSKRS
jgi:hypothetical protein